MLTDLKIIPLLLCSMPVNLIIDFIKFNLNFLANKHVLTNLKDSECVILVIPQKAVGGQIHLNAVTVLWF